MPKRLYVDRRGSPWRRLVNEAELADALATRGFQAIRPEALSIAEQIALFRHAELIVAPQGAGLANLVFARTGRRIIELLMDSYVNWSVRHLAGVFGLDHDCVIGRCLGPWFDLSPDVHGATWAVSVTHVLAAVEGLHPGSRG